jgi:DNA-binding SARP family transcriptional activator
VLKLSVLGGFGAQWESGEALALVSKKACALLVYLALQPERLHSREALADLLWAESAPEQARASLRQAIAVLRRACDRSPGLLMVEAERIGIDQAQMQVDATLFEGRLADGTSEALRSGISLYRGPLLEGFAVTAANFESWLQAQRERLTGLALGAFEQDIAAALGRDPTAAADLAHRLLALDPTREAGHRALMRIRAAEGDRAAAIRQYQLCIATLRRELGAQPAPETRDVYQEILRSSGAPRAAASTQSPAQPVPAAAVPQTGLFGRGGELARLLGALENAAAGRGSLLAVVGEAGIGKSRLVAELVERARAAGHNVLLGHCYDAGQIQPYQIWTDALLPLAGGDAVRRLSAEKRAALVGLSPTLAGATRPGKPARLLDPRPIFEAVAALLREAAAERPLLVVLEDLHWSDDLSLRLLAFVGRLLRDRGIAFVATVRSEELHDVPILRQLLANGGAGLALEQLPLGPLSRGDTAALVRAMAGSRKQTRPIDEVAAQLWSLGQGHPFMTVEAMHAIQQGDAMVFSRRMPQRVEQLIDVRLARLTSTARQLAAIAAVIGRPFDIALLREASGMEEAQTTATAEELVRRGIFDAIGVDLKFAHDRFRETIYAELLAPIRRALHSAVARALELAETGDLAPHYSALAIHHRESEGWDAAQHYYHEAGLQALSSGALRAAGECFEQALQALARLPDSQERRERRVDLGLALHYALIPLGQSTDFRRHLDQISELVGGRGDRRLDGYLAAYRASDAYFTGALPEAIAHAEQALAIAGETGDARLRDLAQHYLMFACHDHADFARALGIIELRLQDLRPEPTHVSVDALVTCHAYRAGCHLSLGDFVAARAAAAAAVRIAERWDSDYFIAYAHYSVGAVELNATDWPAAIDALELALQLARTHEIGLLLPAAASALGLAQIQGKRSDAGILLLDQSASQIRVAGATMWIAIYEYRLAEGCFLTGRAVEARAALDRAVAAATARGDRVTIAWATWLEGEMAIQAADATTAALRLDQAAALARSLGLAPLLAACRVSRSKCLRHQNDDRAADAELAAGLKLLRDMGMTGRLAEASSLLGDAPVI